MVKPEYSMTIFFLGCAVAAVNEHQTRLTIKRDLSNFKTPLFCFKNNDNNNFELPIMNYLINPIQEYKCPQQNSTRKKQFSYRNIDCSGI